MRHSSTGEGDTLSSTILASATALPPPGTVEVGVLGWAPSHLVMHVVDSIHQVGDIPYWESIVVFTVAFRLGILPLGIWTAQGSARMAAVRPHIQRLSDEQKHNPNQDSRAKQKFAVESKALMKQFKVNPLASLLMPLVQFPIFMSCYFGLQSMGNFFPDFSTGGAYWFINLSAADPYMILPALNAASFLIMIELGADGLQSNDQDTFRWIMRGLAVALTPLTMHLPQGLFIYWGVNNAFSIAQALVLKNQGIRKYLDIPKPPSAAASLPGLKLNKLNPFGFISEAIKREKEVDETAKAEIIDGIATKSVAPSGPSSPPPLVFKTSPKRQIKGAKK